MRPPLHRTSHQGEREVAARAPSRPQGRFSLMCTYLVVTRTLRLRESTLADMTTGTHAIYSNTYIRTPIYGPLTCVEYWH